MTIKNNAYDFAAMTLEELRALPFVKILDNAIFLSIYVQPNAKETAIVGLHNTKLKIKIAATPVEGKANKILCAFISKQFSIPISRVMIVRGENARVKTLKIII